MFIKGADVQRLHKLKFSSPIPFVLKSDVEVLEGEDDNNPIIPMSYYFVQSDTNFNGHLSLYDNSKLIQESSIINGKSDKLDLDMNKLLFESGYEIIITESE